MAKRTILALPAATLAAVFAASAPASPGTKQYDNPVPREKPPTLVAPAQNAGGGSLPFTGLELGLIVAGGCGAAGAGLVLRRATRGRRE